MGKHSITIGIVVLIIIILIVINNKNNTNGKRSAYKDITGDEAKAELEKDSNIIILDVRTKEEHNERCIKNSISIPLNELESRAEKEIQNKESKIFVYCKTGVRSRTACETLVALGYTNIFNLGGIINWEYEVE